MKIYIYCLFIANMLFATHFNLELEETGSSTLFIFSDTVSSLDTGDELGLFDESGVIDSDGNIGELLVGHGVWTGDQLELTSINTDFPLLL